MAQKLKPQAETLSGSPQPNFTNYSTSPIKAKRSPAISDTGYDLGQIWINKLTGKIFILSSVSAGSASWSEVGGGTDTYPITPYVVGPVGDAGFQTIQSALNAANAAGGGIVYVQAGTYTENLTLYGNTQVVAVPGNSDAATTGNTVVISGVHTPPTSGSFAFVSIRLASATHIFNSSAAGTASLLIMDVIVAVTNGYIFNLPNWTGALITYNCGEASTNNGVVNNTAGSECFFISATHGAGTGQTMITSGVVEMQEVDLNCPWSAATGTTIECDYVVFTQSVTCANNSTGYFDFCKFSTGSAAAVTMSSSGAIKLTDCIIDSTANPCIAGSGAGALTLTCVNFLANSSLAGTLTTSNLGRTTSGGFKILTGTNSTIGTSAAMTAGSITISTTAVTASSKIFLTAVTPGGTQGTLSVGTIVAGTSFVINSSSGSDTSTVNWLIIN